MGEITKTVKEKWIDIALLIIGLVIAFTLLQSDVEVNAGNIEKLELRVQKVEESIQKISTNTTETRTIVQGLREDIQEVKEQLR